MTADALDVDLAELTAGAGLVDGWSPTCPTTSPRQLVIRALDEAPDIDSMVVMVQREVAERLVGRRPARRPTASRRS